MSSPKQPNLDDIEDPPEIEYGYSSDDECFEGMSREEIKEFKLYDKQLRESDGFDVDFVPTAYPSVIGSHVYVCDLNDPEEYEETEECTQFVIDKYNEFMKGNSRLRLEWIPKANRTSPNYISNFYITFEAEDTVSGRSDTYQTLIWQQPTLGIIRIIFIRKKSDKKEICFPVDLDDPEEFVKLNKCAELAISEYNEEKEGKSELEFVRVVNAFQNMNMYSVIYSITFEAKDPKSDQINTYTAQILYVSKEDCLYVPKEECINVVNWPELEEDE